MATQRQRYQWQGIFDDVFLHQGTYDAASLATGAARSDTIAVPGVQLGDMVVGIALGVNLAGLTITGYVSAANTVTLRLDNLTGGAVDLASTTLRILVGRPAAGSWA